MTELQERRLFDNPESNHKRRENDRFSLTSFYLTTSAFVYIVLLPAAILLIKIIQG